MNRSDPRYEITRLATDIALQAPLWPKHRTVYIDAATVAEIRAELDRLGIPWRRHHREAR